MIFDLHPAVAQLVDLGLRRGWLSYEELNNVLPDEMVDPVIADFVSPAVQVTMGNRTIALTFPRE